MRLDINKENFFQNFKKAQDHQKDFSIITAKELSAKAPTFSTNN